MRSLLALSLLLPVFGCVAADADLEPEALEPAVTTKAVTVLRMRSLAPSGSTWATVLRHWGDEVHEQSGGGLSIVWTWNGGGRGEEAIVSDLTSDSLDGGLVTTTALGGLVPDYEIFSLPGLFTSWAQLDAARTAESAYFDQRFADAGVVLLGTADIGAAKIMGTSDRYEDEIWRPENLRGKDLFTTPGDVIGPEVVRTSGLRSTAVSVPEVLGKLGSSVNTIIVAPYAAVQLQWAPRIKYILRGVTPSYQTGALVVSKARFDALTAEEQELLSTSAREVSRELQQTIRNDDARAYALISSRPAVRTHDATAEEKTQWASAFRRARAAVRSQFSPDLLRRVCGDRC
jgi:TRAP-type transport system periplasmic protein